jgi:hypothetical protein
MLRGRPRPQALDRGRAVGQADAVAGQPSSGGRDPYRDVPLGAKLGIKAGSVAVLVRPPERFEDLLAPLPDAAVCKRVNRGRRDLTVWFVSDPGELSSGIGRVIERLDGGALWIAWRKKGSPGEDALGHAAVQRAGLDQGLVDSKICSIDETWSALRFTRRAARSA